MAGLTGLFVAKDSGGNGTTAKGARLALAGLLFRNGPSALDVRPGVVADGLGTVVTGTAGMAYSVRAAQFVTVQSTANGPTLFANDAAVSVTTTAAPSSNSRIDVVWARQKLIAGDGGAETTSAVEFGVTQGAANATPTVPAIPAGAMSLAEVRVTANAATTSGLTFTRTHKWTTTNGGILPVDTVAERDALTARRGLLVDNAAMGLERFDGVGWTVVNSNFKRNFFRNDAAISYVNGGVIGTMVFPSIPVASRIVINVQGQVGFSAAQADNRIDFTFSAGTPVSSSTQLVTALAAKWSAYSRTSYVDVPANTAVTVTTNFVTTAGPGGYWGGMQTGTVLLPGEY